MGSLLSKWRKKPSTIEILEKLDKDIKSLEKLKQSNLDFQKKIIGSLLLYSVIAYIVLALVFYFYYFPDHWPDRLLYSSPLLVFPIIVWLLKRFLHWYFVKRIAKNESALESLRDEKKTILEEVMERETYKKARDILEKFDPERFKKLEAFDNLTAPHSPPAEEGKTPEGQVVRQRTVTRPVPGTGPRSIPPQSGSFADTPHLPRQVQVGPGSMRANGQHPRFITPRPPPGPPMPRPVLPRERSTTEKLIEYLVGDGPQNRYALICQQCLSHNGMAMKEEFEYLAFRCCYCFNLNPARKQRPKAPELTSPVRKVVHAQQDQADARGEAALRPRAASHHEDDMEVDDVTSTAIRSELLPEISEPDTGQSASDGDLPDADSKKDN